MGFYGLSRAQILFGGSRLRRSTIIPLGRPSVRVQETFTATLPDTSDDFCSNSNVFTSHCASTDRSVFEYTIAFLYLNGDYKSPVSIAHVNFSKHVTRNYRVFETVAIPNKVFINTNRRTPCSWSDQIHALELHSGLVARGFAVYRMVSTTFFHRPWVVTRETNLRPSLA